MLRNRWKRINNATTNVTSILLGALLFGLTVGFPMGYFARQLSADLPNTDVASLQQK